MKTSAALIASAFAIATVPAQAAVVAEAGAGVQVAEALAPLAHGEAIATRISGAQLRVLRGVGHNHPASLKPLICEQLLSFLSGLEHRPTK